MFFCTNMFEQNPSLAQQVDLGLFIPNTDGIRPSSSKTSNIKLQVEDLEKSPRQDFWTTLG